jgi:hypothetical protein
MEFRHRGVAVLQHLDVELQRDGLRLRRRDALDELVHELAPGPEVVLRPHLAQPRHAALEGVRVQVGHAGQDRAAQPVGVAGRRIGLHGDDLAVLDADQHVARPARGQQRLAREVLFHAAIIATCTMPSG